MLKWPVLLVVCVYSALWAWDTPFSASQRTHVLGVAAPLAAGAGGPGIWGVGESMHQCVLGWRGGWFVRIENPWPFWKLFRNMEEGSKRLGSLVCCNRISHGCLVWKIPVEVERNGRTRSQPTRPQQCESDIGATAEIRENHWFPTPTWVEPPVILWPVLLNVWGAGETAF